MIGWIWSELATPTHLAQEKGYAYYKHRKGGGFVVVARNETLRQWYGGGGVLGAPPDGLY